MTAFPLRVGTDCSGVDAPIVALKNLGVEHEQAFASETDPACVRTILLNGDPHGVWGDVSSRDPEDEASFPPPVDLYVCGFPCQPFSRAGSERGVDDPRGTVFEHCVSYVRLRRPRWFVFENVPRFRTASEGRAWDRFWSALRSIPGYSVSWSFLNTKDYGVPQSRRRLYVVGTRDGEAPFEFPAPVGQGASHAAYVDLSDASTPRPTPQVDVATSLTPTLLERGGVFVDTLQYRTVERVPRKGFSVATCVLCSSYVWCVPARRWANRKELLSLQGFPTDFLFHESESESSVRKQIGNAMSVNVLEALFTSLLRLPRPFVPRSSPYERTRGGR